MLQVLGAGTGGLAVPSFPKDLAFRPFVFTGADGLWHCPHSLKGLVPYDFLLLQVLMDFGSARPRHTVLQSRQEAMQLAEDAAVRESHEGALLFGLKCW